MSDKQPTAPKAIRLVFELAHADNPRLFEELNRFAQGPKRVNRLRVLAYDGLLVQQGVLAICARDASEMSQSARDSAKSGHITDQLFAPGLSE